MKLTLAILALCLSGCTQFRQDVKTVRVTAGYSKDNGIATSFSFDLRKPHKTK